MEDEGELADGVGPLQHLGVSIGDQVILSRKSWVSRVLVHGVYPAIADSDTCQVDGRFICQLHGTGNIGNVVTSVALTS